MRRLLFSPVPQLPVIVSRPCLSLSPQVEDFQTEYRKGHHLERSSPLKSQVGLTRTST